MKFYAALQENHHYTDYQIKVIHYALITIASEISKFLMLGAFFFALGKLTEYLWAMLLFLCLRRYSGGIHCKTYLGCLAVSFGYIAACVLVLPSLSIQLQTQKILLLGSMAVLAVISPIPSVYHAKLKKPQSIRYKIYVLIFTGVYFMLVSKLYRDPYYVTGFWIILMHTIQLTIFYFQRRFTNEKSMDEQNA